MARTGKNTARKCPGGSCQACTRERLRLSGPATLSVKRSIDISTRSRVDFDVAVDLRGRVRVRHDARELVSHVQPAARIVHSATVTRMCINGFLKP